MTDNIMHKFGRYEVHYLEAESNEDLVWDEEQRAFLQYGVFNTVMNCYEAYSPVEGAAIMMAVEYQDLLNRALGILERESFNQADVDTSKEVKH